MNPINVKAIRSTLIGAAVMAALILVPAGTLRYWQAWVFMAVFEGSSIAVGVYLAIRDPQLLARRLKAGPAAERETTQKVIMTLAMLGFAALMVVPGLDRRFGWSFVPTPVVLAGDVLIALAFLFIVLVFRENTYGASTIHIAEGHRVISTGPYAFVRHPMYAGGIVMLIGVPLALGSWWALLVLLLIVPVLIWRLRDEERFLTVNLPGYAAYTRRVRYRLLPYAW